ncbi:hypothetical protein EXD82_09360 [Peptacetobacter hominis]|uniref:Rhodanese domain-containing protein n=1 Tax=Peptacetobacter hominis TaxID=2743610 RepID=A0A544QT73_9FIRM|nr:hypothetical protein [Peptacetobacter hominis]TQQ83892.1 hypothetical protein EXD82_09360 [Peptacetobacter hominis]
MFIKFEDISDEVLIDCRTKEEFAEMPLFDKNIPIIDKKTHNMIKRFYPCALFVILFSLIKNKDSIRKKILEYSVQGEKKVVFGCSRGRLRSPIMCLYARYIGVESVVLSKGIKRFFKTSSQKNNILE